MGWITVAVIVGSLLAASHLSGAAGPPEMVGLSDHRRSDGRAGAACSTRTSPAICPPGCASAGRTALTARTRSSSQARHRLDPAAARARGRRARASIKAIVADCDHAPVASDSGAVALSAFVVRVLPAGAPNGSLAALPSLERPRARALRRRVLPLRRGRGRAVARACADAVASITAGSTPRIGDLHFVRRQRRDLGQTPVRRVPRSSRQAPRRSPCRRL